VITTTLVTDDNSLVWSFIHLWKSS